MDDLKITAITKEMVSIHNDGTIAVEHTAINPCLKEFVEEVLYPNVNDCEKILQNIDLVCNDTQETYLYSVNSSHLLITKAAAYFSLLKLPNSSSPQVSLAQLKSAISAIKDALLDHGVDQHGYAQVK